MLSLALMFFVTAVLYAAVGFGGGSTYNALLILGDVDYRILPSIALICNLIVVTGGSIQFARAGQLNWHLILPFVALSVPMAWMGGRLPVDRNTFVLLLGLSLLFAGVTMLLDRRRTEHGVGRVRTRTLWALGLPAGAGLGLLAGIVGIGGGIFLAPLLHLFRVAGAKAIAATATVFILINSTAGLLGQAAKIGAERQFQESKSFGWLFVAVLAGGQIGSRLSSTRLSPYVVRTMTAILVLVVAARLLFSWANI